MRVEEGGEMRVEVVAAEVAMVVETTAAEITAAADLVDLTIFVFHQEQI